MHGGIESRDHLFFECQFTALVWESVKSKCGVYSPVVDLANEIRWGFRTVRGGLLSSSLVFLLLYIILGGRGMAGFSNRLAKILGLLEGTLGWLVTCACSWRYVPVTAENQRMCMEWETSLTVFKQYLVLLNYPISSLA